MTENSLCNQQGSDTQVDGKGRTCWALGPHLGTQALKASTCTP